ncbi:chymotrypsin-like [Chrysoperla carnea]|uniref:chymotrypsin-like n=1 Tax=Chrysoperla carnea TaxID=189513 RepID=UPI001D077BD5|nr:chymotrypsin-like [Chrysoperla carnea]
MKYNIVFLVLCSFNFGLGQKWQNWHHIINSQTQNIELKNLKEIKSSVNEVHHEYLFQKKVTFQNGFEKPENRIVNGSETLPHQYPFQAAILAQEQSVDVDFCGGTLITKRFVLTAAHCLYGYKHLTVVLGAHNLSINEPSQQVFYTDEFVVHPRWFVTFLISRNDVGLVKLPRDALLNEFVQTIRLPRLHQMETTFSGMNATTIGWGKTKMSENVHRDVLRHVSNPIVAYESCREQFAAYIPIDKKCHICFSNEQGRGVCNGDSGGPLIIRDEDGEITQVGVTSFITACENPERPAGFARISSYLYFIAENSDYVLEQ